MESWGLLRDSGRLDLLRDTFAPGAVMHTSNWSGPAEEFIENARKSPSNTGMAQHIYGGGNVEIVGEKALADSRMVVMSRKSIGSVEVDLTGFVRMIDCFVRADGRWRILERFPLYERDRLDLVDKTDAIDIDLTPLVDYPSGLRHIAFVQRANGRDIPAPMLAMSGKGFPAAYAKWRDWLQS